MRRLLISPLLALLASPVLAGAPLILEPRHDPEAPPHQFATAVPLRLTLPDFEPLAAPLAPTHRQREIHAPGAPTLGFYASRLELPDGVSLHLRTAYERQLIQGPYRGGYESPPLAGDTLTLTLEIPAGTDWRTVDLVIDEVAVGRPDRSLSVIAAKQDEERDDRFDNDRPQEQAPRIWYACADPAKAKPEYAAATVLVVVRGTRHCSGVLINHDQAQTQPWALTAAHCVGEERYDPHTYADRLVAYFKVRAETCPEVDDGPFLSESARARSIRTVFSGYDPEPPEARLFYSDTWIVELEDYPVAAAGAWLAGVDWENVQPYFTEFDIPHHGAARPLQYARRIHRRNGTYPGPERGGEVIDTDSYLARYVDGRTEGGASGSPAFNPEGRVIGILVSSRPERSSNFITSTYHISHPMLEQGIIVSKITDNHPAPVGNADGSTPRPTPTPTPLPTPPRDEVVSASGGGGALGGAALVLLGLACLRRVRCGREVANGDR